MRTVPLGEACEIVSGATPRSGFAEYWGGEIAWVTPADLSSLGGPYIKTTPRTLTAAGLASCSSRVLPAGSVLLSSRAPIGHVAINAVPMATNQGFKSLIPRPGVLDGKYLFHWLRHNKGHLQTLGNGATFKELSKATVERIEVPVPSLDEQRRIAAILDQVARLNSNLEDVVSRQQELLDVLVESALSAVPKARYERFGPHCSRLTVGVVIQPASHYVGHGVPALRTINVRPGRLDLQDLVFFSLTSNDGPLAKSKLSAGDVVIARTGKPGTAAVIPEALSGANAIDLILVTPRGTVDPFYLESLMNSSIGQKLVAVEQRGQIQQHLNVGSLREAMLPIPPLSEQRKLVEKTSLVRGHIIRQNERKREIENLAYALNAKAFSGQL